MSKFLHSMGTSLAGMWRGREGLSLKSIRWNRSFYVMAYVFELLFYSYHKTFLYTDTELFGVSPYMLMYIGHLLMSLVIMLLWSARFKRLIHISIAATLFGFLTFMLLPEGILKLLCAVMTMTGLGGCVTSARCGFAFAANNTERMLGVVMALGGRALLGFTDVIFPDGFFWDNFLFYYIFPVFFLVGLTICLLRFREADLEVKENATPEDSRGLYWAFAIFITFFTIEGYTRFMYNSDYAHATLLFGVGHLVAIALFIFVLFLLKKNIWHIWNLFFGICIVTTALAIFAYNPVLNAPIHLLLGVFDVGWLAALYMLGCAQRRFSSYKLLKQCTLVFVIISPLTTLSDEIVELLFPQAVSAATLVFVLVIIVAFLLTSPYSHKHLFSATWLSDLHKNDMALLQEKVTDVDRFAKYGLTRREKEVATLLLDANTIRMISGKLKISESTAKMHTSNLYKKMKINSRTELFRMFGVSETNGASDV